jgi:phage shock protein A
MGFLSGKKKVDAERGMLEIKGTMNALTLRIRRLDTRRAEEQKKAKESMSQGDRGTARSHLSIVVELESRRGRYQQQYLTLETALLNIEEAKDQAEVGHLQSLMKRLQMLVQCLDRPRYKCS